MQVHLPGETREYRDLTRIAAFRPPSGYISVRFENT
jgi:hypothetical protein